ncbi:MAG TPA: Mur ligase domain-containing protein [Candidatus Methanoperedens sp.]|nr:Mur ligase domain-containing protein [Candidatus Methanoperedens sp.]
MHEKRLRVHFLGIGGSGMATAAALAADAGCAVTGSDAGVFPPMSDFLHAKGLAVREGYGPENLEPAPDLVVVGNALSRGNPEIEALLDRRLPYCSLPEFLREHFFPGRRVTAICGTHGKTTITTLLAWLLESAGRSPTFLAGGVALNFGGGGRLGSGEDFLIEGDEYDTAFFDKRSKFLVYRPHNVVLANVEFDHADIFASLADYTLAFRRLVNLVPGNGFLVVNAGDPLATEIAAPCRGRVIPVAPGDPAPPEFTLPGEHFRMDAQLAAAAAAALGLTPGEIARGMADYRGVKRRLEAVFSGGGVTLYDDFAHHPTAIRLDLETLRAKHPGARIRALFEPRSNTLRRTVFQEALPAAFAAADEVIVGAVHRAAQLAEAERLDPLRLARDVAAAGRPARYIEDVGEIVAAVLGDLRPGDVVAVLSNGAFGGLIPRLRAAIEAWAARR